MHIESRFDARPIKHAGKRKKPVCGDSRHDLNYSEIPTSWNNGEIGKMEMRFAYHSETTCFYRVKTLRGFERIIRDLLERNEKPYRLFISYKCRHRVKKVAGRIFMWDETEETLNGIDVESGEQGFGKPRFDGVYAALFITDDGIVAFGDARLIAEEEIGRVGKDILCTVYLRGRLAEQFKMSWEVFIRFFVRGLVEK